MFKICESKRGTGVCAAYRCSNPAQHGTLCFKHKARRRKAIDPTGYTYDRLKQNAKRRGKSFDLTVDEFREWAAKTGYIDGKGRKRNGLSIDRIDPTKGYSLDNIQILTVSANSSKWSEYVAQQRNNGHFGRSKEDPPARPIEVGGDPPF